ncbi:hypothetical protein NDU88_000719 [Pleurodeles waltl]|uniref:Uncharacterized protein n=1 Tax=Pleurodeles waltl TaxID=8319 RepID=A0AAV7L7R3_PLEWA|nr:hypothetical protein NDU88_000719 [Pleurodeles waltl]
MDKKRERGVSRKEKVKGNEEIFKIETSTIETLSFSRCWLFFSVPRFHLFFPTCVLSLSLLETTYHGRGRATKQDGRLERELRAEAVPEGRWGRGDSRTTHRVRCPSTLTTSATRNHVRGPRRSGTQGRKLATRPRPIRPDKRGGVASSGDRGRRARSGKEQTEQAAGTAGAVTTRIHLSTTPTNTRGPSTPHRETWRRSKGVRPLRQPGEKPGQREGQQEPSRWDNKLSPPSLQTTNTEEGRGARREARGGEETRRREG